MLLQGAWVKIQCFYTENWREGGLREDDHIKGTYIMLGSFSQPKLIVLVCCLIYFIVCYFQAGQWMLKKRKYLKFDVQSINYIYLNICSSVFQSSVYCVKVTVSPNVLPNITHLCPFHSTPLPLLPRITLLPTPYHPSATQPTTTLPHTHDCSVEICFQMHQTSWLSIFLFRWMDP